MIQLHNVNHYYGSAGLRRQVLFDVGVTVAAGEIVLLTGPCTCLICSLGWDLSG